MNRPAALPHRRARRLLAIAVLGGAIGSLVAADVTSPNVVIFYTDDQSIGQFGCYGGQPTPNIDRLAAEGVRFERMYVSAPLCAPSRWGLQTGRYASAAPGNLRKYPAGGYVCVEQHVGIEENRPAEKWNLPVALKGAGYATGFVGKYQLGFMGTPVTFANDASLDDPAVVAGLRHNFELAQKGAYAGGYDYAEALYHDNAQIPRLPSVVRYHNQEWITWKALEFIEQNRERPFLLVVNPTLVHFPPSKRSLHQSREITPIGRVAVPDVQPDRQSVLERAERYERSAEGRIQAGPQSAGLIWLDDAVGVIVRKLELLGLAKKTLVLVIADHGLEGKWTVRHDGIRTGGLAWWPGRIQPGRVSTELVQNVDIAPTVLELCGAEAPADAEMHGVSFAGHLVDGLPGRREYAFAEMGYQRTIVRADGMKYNALRFPPAIRSRIDAGTPMDIFGRPALKKNQKLAEPDELFDLRRDPQEKRNLAHDPAYAETLAAMKALMSEQSAKLPHAFGEFTE